MPDHAGFAGALTIREHALRAAVQASYANGSDDGKRFVEDLSGGGLGMEPDLFLGQLVIDCEGGTNLLVVALPMWGRVTVTKNQVTHVVDVSGEMELTLTPAFRTGPPDTPTESSIVVDRINTTVDARRWDARITSAGSPPEIAALVTGDEFRARFEQTFRRGVVFGRVPLPSIDASFLGPLARTATSVSARVRSGALLIGLNHVDATHDLVGSADDLEDFARGNDVAGVVHPGAMDIMLDDLYQQVVDGVEDAGATLDRFTVRARDGHFHVAGAASKTGATVNFSFRVLRSMFHTRPGAFFRDGPRTIFVRSRTWPALNFHVEDVETDADRSWWLILFGEVVLGIFTLGISVMVIEGMARGAADSFGARIRSARPGTPVARVRRTIPPDGGVGVRIGLDHFDITESGVYVGVSVRATPSPAALLGPTTVPETYRGDVLRYILQLPSGVTEADPGLRVRWTLADRTNDVTLKDVDGPATNRLRFEFRSSSGASDFGITARLYRRMGADVTELGIESVNLQMRPVLPPRAYVRWRWQGKNPQVAVDEATDTWTYRGQRRVDRYSEWHRTDEPCRAVEARARYRYQVEEADRLPFPLRTLENHRKGLCPYCFFGGPAGRNASL